MSMPGIRKSLQIKAKNQQVHHLKQKTANMTNMINKRIKETKINKGNKKTKKKTKKRTKKRSRNKSKNRTKERIKKVMMNM